MTLDELRQGNPSLYQQCLDIGAAQHRKDLLAALPKPGLGATAWHRYTFECIANGTPLTDLVRARHGVFAMRAARQQPDSEQVGHLVLQALGAES